MTSMHRRRCAIDTGLRRLRYFAALAEDPNFHRTAERLGLTQPALSRAIALLEADVGATLLERGRGGARLTAAGLSFAAGCRGVLAALDGAVLQARRIADGEAGQLVIGYTDTAMTGCLPDIVRGFRDAYPDVEVVLRQGYTNQQRRWLREGGIDVAFVTGPLVEDGHEAVEVQRDRFVAILPEDHPLAGRSSLALAELAGEPFVLGDPDHWEVYNRHLLGLCAAAGFSPRVVQRAPDSRGIIGLVSCGMGLSVQTESLTRHADGRVVFAPLHDCVEHVVTEAVWNVRFDYPPRRRFVEYLARRPAPHAS